MLTPCTGRYRSHPSEHPKPAPLSAHHSDIADRHRIKCVRCDKVKASTAFSKKQQSELKMKIHKDGAFNAVAIKYIVCIGCTGGQVVELECRMCGITKGLDKFSKNQRRARDNAVRCLASFRNKTLLLTTLERNAGSAWRSR